VVGAQAGGGTREATLGGFLSMAWGWLQLVLAFSNGAVPAFLVTL
jgi:hypothetical protein